MNEHTPSSWYGVRNIDCPSIPQDETVSPARWPRLPLSLLPRPYRRTRIHGRRSCHEDTRQRQREMHQPHRSGYLSSDPSTSLELSQNGFLSNRLPAAGGIVGEAKRGSDMNKPIKKSPVAATLLSPRFFVYRCTFGCPYSPTFVRSQDEDSSMLFEATSRFKFDVPAVSSRFRCHALAATAGVVRDVAHYTAYLDFHRMHGECG